MNEQNVNVFVKEDLLLSLHSYTASKYYEQRIISFRHRKSITLQKNTLHQENKNIIKQDIEVEEKSYEAVKQFINFGPQLNSKNSIQEEIRLRIQAGNRSLQLFIPMCCNNLV